MRISSAFLDDALVGPNSQLGDWPFEDLDPREVMSPAELLEDALLDASPTERRHMLACLQTRYFW